jgi:hypothetical protein
MTQQSATRREWAVTYVSLLLSLGALGYAAWVHQAGETLADRALQRREARLVRQWAPRLEIAYRDMLADPAKIPKDPTTLEELLEPLITLVNQVGADPASGTNKATLK